MQVLLSVFVWLVNKLSAPFVLIETRCRDNGEILKKKISNMSREKIASMHKYLQGKYKEVTKMTKRKFSCCGSNVAYGFSTVNKLQEQSFMRVL